MCLSYNKPKQDLSHSPEQNKKYLDAVHEKDSEIKKIKEELIKSKSDLKLKDKELVLLKSDTKVKKAGKYTDREHTDVEHVFKPFFEINITEIIFKEKITEGGYGIVYTGKWHETSVAIKEIKYEFVTQDKLEEFYSIQLTQPSAMSWGM